MRASWTTGPRVLLFDGYTTSEIIYIRYIYTCIYRYMSKTSRSSKGRADETSINIILCLSDKTMMTEKGQPPCVYLSEQNTLKRKKTSIGIASNAPTPKPRTGPRPRCCCTKESPLKCTLKSIPSIDQTIKQSNKDLPNVCCRSCRCRSIIDTISSHIRPAAHRYHRISIRPDTSKQPPLLDIPPQTHRPTVLLFEPLNTYSSPAARSSTPPPSRSSSVS